MTRPWRDVQRPWQVEYRPDQYYGDWFLQEMFAARGVAIDCAMTVVRNGSKLDWRVRNTDTGEVAWTSETEGKT